MTRFRYFLIALIPALLLISWHYFSPTRQLMAAQQRLVAAISAKDATAINNLVHPDYTDQWSFTAADWPGLLKDLRTISPILEVNLLNPVLDGATGVVDTSLQVKSTGGPASELIAGRAVALKETTRFIWKRFPWQPWSWRLVGVQNPSFEIPADYRPGHLTAMPTF